MSGHVCRDVARNISTTTDNALWFKYYDQNEILLINPILIIEVLSKGTKMYDHTEKFSKYKTM